MEPATSTLFLLKCPCGIRIQANGRKPSSCFCGKEQSLIIVAILPEALRAIAKEDRLLYGYRYGYRPRLLIHDLPQVEALLTGEALPPAR